MPALTALQNLKKSLNEVLEDLFVQSGNFGFPQEMEKVAKKLEQMYQGYAKQEPNQKAIRNAVVAFLRGRPLSNWDKDLVAFMITGNITELNGASVITSPKLDELLDYYRSQVKQGNMWLLSWHALLMGYFAFDPNANPKPESKGGWKSLGEFLRRTWPAVDKGAGQLVVPDWVSTLRRENDLLSEQPTDKYADEVLQGNNTSIERISNEIGIPDTSWFWHSVVLGCVRFAVRETDNGFIELIPRLIELLRKRSAFRDEAIKDILIRYHSIRGAGPHHGLRDYVCSPDVWKNPKLKLIKQGGASWSRVPEDVWRMVLGWVNERNLKDFFDILAARNKAEAGRLNFWSQYLDQILWTRLVFGSETMALKNRNAEVRRLIAAEQGMYAEITSPSQASVDAFMMQISDYVIVEFSKKPNACYVYKANKLPFQPYANSYKATTQDLKKGYYGEYAARITHTPDWEDGARNSLKRLGILPDPPRTTQSSSHSGRNFSETTTNQNLDLNTGGADVLDQIDALMQLYPEARIDDKRRNGKGRIWVIDPRQRQQLGNELRALGFGWSASTSAWFYQII